MKLTEIKLTIDIFLLSKYCQNTVTYFYDLSVYSVLVTKGLYSANGVNFKVIIVVHGVFFSVTFIFTMQEEKTKTLSIGDKIMLLGKSVGLVFNDNKIGNIAKEVIESSEFKGDASIIQDLSNLNDCDIVSNTVNILKKELRIEWNMENQNTFYNVLCQIFKHDVTDINVIMMNNISTFQDDVDEPKEGMDEYKRKGILVLGGSFSPCHTEHVELLNEIKQSLEQNENFIIVAAYLVVTTDGW